MPTGRIIATLHFQCRRRVTHKRLACLFTFFFSKCKCSCIDVEAGACGRCWWGCHCLYRSTRTPGTWSGLTQSGFGAGRPGRGHTAGPLALFPSRPACMQSTQHEVCLKSKHGVHKGLPPVRVDQLLDFTKAALFFAQTANRDANLVRNKNLNQGRDPASL